MGIWRWTSPDLAETSIAATIRYLSREEQCHSSKTRISRSKPPVVIDSSTAENSKRLLNISHYEGAMTSEVGHKVSRGSLLFLQRVSWRPIDWAH